VKRFRGGLVFKAHRLLYHSTLGLRVIKKKKKKTLQGEKLRSLGFLPRSLLHSLDLVGALPLLLDSVYLERIHPRGNPGAIRWFL